MTKKDFTNFSVKQRDIKASPNCIHGKKLGKCKKKIMVMYFTTLSFKTPCPTPTKYNHAQPPKLVDLNTFFLFRCFLILCRLLFLPPLAFLHEVTYGVGDLGSGEQEYVW